jgi:hypothetical protein
VIDIKYQQGQYRVRELPANLDGLLHTLRIRVTGGPWDEKKEGRKRKKNSRSYNSRITIGQFTIMPL